ncbi:hypothetical protein PhCBS80983_g01054 [Powellomyces hirtus]|uniref:SEC7 domain-containing protein n=1 Tax=Powellomyces hirtus TaxID=109895 RepID=A0A507EBR5_9FUNG|nr:hypothetical protein PhCBS80983_g01054 [Powellomyces hirtus]
MTARNSAGSSSAYRPVNRGGSQLPLDGTFTYQPSRKARPELDWRYLVQNEIVSVTNALRKNQRWNMPFERDRRTETATTPSYDFCQENANHGYASLDAVIEFTAVAAKSGRAPMATVDGSPLMNGFSLLRARLTLLHALRDVNPLDLLEPFLAVIRSPDTTGPMTHAALTSVEKFITYRVLDPNHPGLALATAALTDAVVRCRFEATDAVADEAVLAKILALLRVILTSEIGQKSLHDKGICEMVEVAFGMIFQGRVNELLRRSAEQTLVVLVQALFERLSVIVRAKEHDNLRSSDPRARPAPVAPINERIGYFGMRGTTGRLSSVTDAASTSEVHEPHEVAANGPTSPQIQMFEPGHDAATREANVISVAGLPASNTNVPDETGEGPRIEVARNEHMLHDGGIHAVRQEHGQTTSAAPVNAGAILESTVGLAANQTLMEQPAINQGQAVVQNRVVAEQPMQPFGLPAILEMLRVLITLIDPRNRQHTDAMHRTVALSLLHAGLEVGGRSLGKLISWKLSGRQRGSYFESNSPGTGTGLSSMSHMREDAERSTEALDEQVSETNRSLGGPSSPSGMSPVGSEEQLTAAALDTEPETWEDAEDRAVLMARELVLNELCKYLLQLLESSSAVTASMPSTTSISILSLSLQCFTRLLQTSPQHLKLQQEWFLKWVIERLDAGVATWDIEDWDKRDPAKDIWHHQEATPQQRGMPVTGEVRELILESLAQLCQMPSFAVELYINYDCDMERPTHLYEDLVTFLAKHSFPDLTPGGLVTSPSHQSICFDTLLILLHHMVERKSLTRHTLPPSGGAASGYQTPLLDLSSDDTANMQPSAPDILRFNKARKRILIEGCERFNKDTKDGIKFLQENNFLPDPLDAQSLAHFFRAPGNINKKVLGEYLAKPKHIDILKAMVQSMDFADKSFDEALRMLLESFRLPGESQQIERIVEVFAAAYFDAMESTGSHDLDNVNAAFVLAYSVIMLNTDLHNKRVKHKMTFEDFKRNLRGVNGDKDFSPEYLKQIYIRIKENEIVLPEEHDGDLGFNYHWKELIKRAENCGPMIPCTKNVYDKDMLLIVWNSVLAAISYAFDTAEDNLTLQKAVVAYHHCSTIAAYYEILEMFDNIVVSLSKMTGLLTESRQLPPEATTIEERKSRSGTFVDPWCADLGRNYRGQVAAVLLFSLVDEYGTSLRKGWRWVIACVRNMYLHSLLPDQLMQTEDFVRGLIIIPRVKDTITPERAPTGAATKRDVGLFSTFANFLSLSSNSPGDWTDYDATPEELSSQRKAMNCIAACKIDMLLSDTRFLEEDTLVFLIDSLAQASFAHEDRGPTQFESPTLHKPKVITGDAASAETGTAASPPPTLKYDAAASFLLELMISITIHNRDRIAVVWPKTFNHIKGIFDNAAHHNVALLERAAINLLRLVLRVGHKDDMLTKIFDSLAALTSLPQESFNAIAEQLMAGLVFILKSDPSIIKRNTHWDAIFTLLARASMVPAASRHSFEATCLIISDGTDSSCVSAENFGDCVDLLIGYAVAARVAVPGSAPLGTALPRGRSSSSPINGGMAGGGSGPTSPTLGSNMRNATSQAAVDQALRALDKLFRLHLRIPSLVQKSGMKMNRAFFEFWLPILSGLSQQLYHPAREVRQYALTHLQRVLLSPQLESGCGEASPEIWADCFENVLFPMLDELLRPEMTRLDPIGLDETRMRAAALLCKIFLQYFPRIHEWQDLPQLWGKILEFMRKYMAAGGSDYLREGVQESLKNMLLVMSTQGIFQPPSEEQNSHYIEPNLWGPTWEYVDSFLPELKSELFPPPSPTSPQPPAPQAPAAGEEASASREEASQQQQEGKPAALSIGAVQPRDKPSGVKITEKPVPVKEIIVEGGSVIVQDDS